VTIKGQHVAVKGPKGELGVELHPEIRVRREEELGLVFERPSDKRHHRALHGMSRALVNNLVVGVTQGFEKRLVIQGVGYSAEMRGKVLNMKLGFTHAVAYHIPEEISVQCPKPTEIVISGIDKQLVGEVAAVIRGIKPPEPYKGKGIRYFGEYVERKAGKAGKTA